MIRTLFGTVHLTVSDASVVVDVSGVGYEVHVGPRMFAELATVPPGEKKLIHIYTHVKEEALELFGFDSNEDRAVFLMLLGVSGVGPATAVRIVDHGKDAVVHAVQQAEVSFFTKMPRVGTKLAQKIIIELGSKVGELKSLELTPLSSLEKTVVEALTSLGFDTQRSEDAARGLDLASMNEQQAVAAALKQLGASS